MYLPDEMFAELKRFARIKAVPMSHVIRKGLRRVLADKDKKKVKFGEGFFGAGGKGSPKDLSTKIDYYLYGGGSEWGKK